MKYLFFLSFCVIASNQAPIRWFDGPLPMALKKAKKEQRPLFLYWGAKWCPPCNQFRSTVLNNNEFQKKISQYIPIYLNGDNPKAQWWGEKLKVYGYPTILILDPLGNEVLRPSASMSPKKFIQVLEQNSTNSISLKETVSKALNAKSLSTSEWKQLSWYSFGQDHHKILGEDPQAALLKLWGYSPPQFKNSFYLQFIDKSSTLGIGEIKKAKVIIEKIMKSKKVFQHKDFFLYAINDTLKKLNLTKKEHKDLEEKWLNILTNFYNSKRLTFDERLSALIPLAKRNSKSIINKINPILDQVTHPEERYSVLTTAFYLYKITDNHLMARQLIMKELPTIHSPEYFMSMLAGLAKKEGKNSLAINWYKKAYDKSQGSATRFQWGTNYLINTLKLSPENPIISSLATKLAKEILKEEDAFYGRNLIRLKRLKKELISWGYQNKQGLEVIKKSWKKLCLQSSSKNCSENLLNFKSS